MKTSELEQLIRLVTRETINEFMNAPKEVDNDIKPGQVGTPDDPTKTVAEKEKEKREEKHGIEQQLKANDFMRKSEEAEFKRNQMKSAQFRSVTKPAIKKQQDDLKKQLSQLHESDSIKKSQLNELIKGIVDEILDEYQATITEPHFDKYNLGHEKYMVDPLAGLNQTSARISGNGETSGAGIGLDPDPQKMDPLAKQGEHRKQVHDKHIWLLQKRDELQAQKDELTGLEKQRHELGNMETPPPDSVKNVRDREHDIRNFEIPRVNKDIQNLLGAKI